MSVYIEIEPGLIIASTVGIDWVQRGTGGQSSTVVYSSGAGSHTIVYASDVLAILAVNDFLAAANALPQPQGGMVPGDTVKVSHHNHARGALGENFTAELIAFPTVDFPFWVVEIPSAVMYVDNVTVSKST